MDVLQSVSQEAIFVGIVIAYVILVFFFGFKNAEQPPFAKLSAGSVVNRKLPKKRVKTANGQVTTEKTSPAKKTVVAKAEAPKKTTVAKDDIDGKLMERKQEDNKTATIKKEKEQVSVKAGKENKIEQVKNKKNLKNLFQERPADFDDGDWEQAYSRKDKKNKKKEEETPSKKSKKTPKKADLINEAKQKEQEKLEIKDLKEAENKELKEEKEVILTPISDEEIGKEKELEKEEQITEQVEKIEKVEKEEKKAGKSKKNKKVSEGENTPASVPSTPKSDIKSAAEEPQEKAINNVEKVAENNAEENKVVQEKTAVFDELGDVWTEAKPQKKSKKKARKDN
ncbi:cilia- and flagella-associated protein 251 isoform X3 [Harpegnathos saltator]|uniref:cilia- and flagella-associated protein 251 isoform X3 n=1 Tax=Harpegnathos saltator TaxID=610380 RepID=UPI00058EDAAC|nr:cilia- and flagella-associated protein 251 isoform X3 [Harpegnathos saltator]